MLDSTWQLQARPKIQRLVHTVVWQYPSSLAFAILPSLSALRTLHIATSGDSKVVPAAVTRLLSILPTVEYISFEGFHRFADDTFSLSTQAPNITRLDIYAPGEESLIPGGGHLRHVHSETIVGIAEILDTLPSLALQVSGGDISELAQACENRSTSQVRRTPSSGSTCF